MGWRTGGKYARPFVACNAVLGQESGELAEDFTRE